MAAQVARLVSLLGIPTAVALGTIYLGLPVIVGGLIHIVAAVYLLLFMPETGFTPTPAPDRTEPGRWRLELMPQTDQAADRFLVVLLPRRLGDAAPHRIRLVEQAGGVAAEVAGPQRTVRYWFREGELGAKIEIVPR